MKLYYITKTATNDWDGATIQKYIAGPFGDFDTAMEIKQELEDSWKYIISVQIVELIY